MYAVFRENTYPADFDPNTNPNFQEFHQAHAGQPGYRGTIVTDAGNGRFLSITLWETEDDMNSARQALGPVVGRLLDPMMVTPSKLHGTGRVVLNDTV